MSQDSDFSREAGAVLASPYFTTPPADLTGEQLFAWWDRAAEEKTQLQDAVAQANSLDDLDGVARDIWDKASKAIEEAMDAADAAERFSQPIAVTPVEGE